MSLARLQLGSVIWAELADANGFVKVPPAVVVSSTDDINAGKPIAIVAVTSRLAHPLPPDYVLLPWHRQGSVQSGLRKPSAAVVGWKAEISASTVRQIMGILGPASIDEILEKLAEPPRP